MKTRITALIVFIVLSNVCFAQQVSYDVSPGDGNGLRFWQSDYYKIHMGIGTEYNYGPVTDYSIKMNMSNDAGRGWTWGVMGQSPIAALDNLGQMQIARGLYIGPLLSSSPEQGRLSVSGESAEISISSREVSSFVASPVNGERWVIYNSGTVSDGKLRLWSGGDKVVFTKEGNVGIGTNSPTARLEVTGSPTGSAPTIRASGGGDVLLNNGGSLFFDGNYSYGTGNYIRPVAANTQAFFTSGSERIRINAAGNVGIGTTSPNEKLTVNGTIYGKEVKVDLSVPGPDYVFEKDYDLPSLEEVESYIDQYKHLPEVPSAKDMEENGISLSEMNMILLRKIEELTLYVIELKRENEEMKSEINTLKQNN